MPKLSVTVNVPLVDTDGEDHRVRKNIDLWDSLTASQRTALVAIMGRITTTIQARYGATGVAESIVYEA